MLEGIGSIKAYIKTQILRQHAERNMKSGSMQGKKDNSQKNSGGLSLPETFVNKNSASNKNTFKIKLIKSKMAYGRKLSNAELKYLRQNASGLYAKAVRINQDREKLEKQCRGNGEFHCIHLFRR